jgi:hypothetical protein
MTTCADRRSGWPSLLCIRTVEHDGPHSARYQGEDVEWPNAEQLDPWFAEQAEHEDRARKLFDEALGEQLMRGFLAAGRSDMVRQLVRDLFRAGFTMHDCRGAFGRKHEGGVCLVPLSQDEGIGVSWAQHDVSYADPGDHQDVQDVCTDWLRDLMLVLGWRTEDFGTAGAFRVIGKFE